MNWTEGALSRHSRRKGWSEDTARQKRYFAKARVRANHGHIGSSPAIARFVPSYIPQSPQAGDHAPEPSTSHRHKRKQSLEAKRASRHRLISSSSRPGNSHSSRTSHTSAVPELSKGSRGSRDVRVTSSDDKVPNIEEERRKLLQKNDWSGMAIQKPPSVDFSWRKDDHSNRRDKTRKPSPRKKSWKTSKVPFGYQNHDESTAVPSGHRVENPMKIRVGSQNYSWSRGNNTIRSPSSSHSHPLASSHWRPQHRTQNSPRTPSRMPFAIASPAGPMSSETSNQSLRLQRSAIGPDRQHLFLGAHKDRPFLKSFNIPQPRLPPSASPEFVVAPSPATIHHPRPTRGNRPPLLDIQTPESDLADSTIAQPDVKEPHRHRPGREDMRWNNWLHSNKDFRPDNDHGKEPFASSSSATWPNADRPDNQLRRISSRVHPSLLHFENETSSIASLTLPSSQPVSLVNDQSSTPRQPIAMTSPRTAGAARAQEDSSNTEGPHDIVLPTPSEMPKMPNAQDLMSLLEQVEHGRNGHDTPVAETEEASDGDGDAVWRKFVFDDDSHAASLWACQETWEHEKRQPCLPPKLLSFANAGSAAKQPSGLCEIANADYQECPEATPTLASSSDFQTTVAMRTTVSPLVKAKSPSHRKETPEFRFHPPRLFIGRLATSQSAGRQRRPAEMRTGMAKGRRKKRRDSERPDIRAVPNFEDDPIEESL